MTPSVSPEADRELTEGGVFYAREGGRELGLAFIAEFERSLIRERQREGIALAKARGAYKGRHRSLSAEQAAELQRRAHAGE